MASLCTSCHVQKLALICLSSYVSLGALLQTFTFPADTLPICESFLTNGQQGWGLFGFGGERKGSVESDTYMSCIC